MKHLSYHNKRVILESKRKLIIAAFVNMLFAAAAVWLKEKYSPVLFWFSIIFFGGGGVLIFVHVLNPKNIFVSPGSDLGKQILTERYQSILQQMGFLVDEEGFSVMLAEDARYYEWKDLKTIFAFKENATTTGKTTLDIFTTDGRMFSINESIPDWSEFLTFLEENFPHIPKDWDTQVASPSFATIKHLLYDANGRTQEQAEKECYPEKNGK